ncbi:MAG: hypothetical protein RR659_05190 [Bacilli bacterium]
MINILKYHYDVLLTKKSFKYFCIIAIIFNLLYAIFALGSSLGYQVNNGFDLGLLFTMDNGEYIGANLIRLDLIKLLAFIILLLYIPNLVANISYDELSFKDTIEMRIGRSKFLKSKLLTSFIIGFTIAFLFYGLNTLFMQIAIDSKSSIISSGISFRLYENALFPMLVETNPNIFALMYCMLISIFYGLIGLITYSLSLIIDRKAITIVAPMLLVFAYSCMLEKMIGSKASIINILIQHTAEQGSNLFILLWPIFFMIVTIISIALKISKEV